MEKNIEFNSLSEAQEAIVNLGYAFLRINTVEEFKKLVMYYNNNDKEDKDAHISAKDNCLLLCENTDFNETYVIDLLYKCLKTSGKDLNISTIYYVNNTEIRNYINTNQDKLVFSDFNELKEFEKSLPTVVGVFYPKENISLKLQDTEITVISEKTIFNFFDTIKGLLK